MELEEDFYENRSYGKTEGNRGVAELYIYRREINEHYPALATINDAVHCVTRTPCLKWVEGLL